MRAAAACGAEVGEGCGVLQAQEPKEIANSMPGKELLPKTVLELWEGLRSKTCKTWSYILDKFAGQVVPVETPGSLAPTLWRSWECLKLLGLCFPGHRPVLWVAPEQPGTDAFPASQRFPLVWGCEGHGSS